MCALLILKGCIMTALVIGGDRIENIRRELEDFGFRDIEHWNGRKPAEARREIPARARLVIMVTDQLSHAMLYSASIKAQRQGLSIIYSRKSAHALREKLVEHYGLPVSRRVSNRVSAGWNVAFATLAMSY